MSHAARTRTAATLRLPTTPAATVIAQSVRERQHASGWPNAKPSYCRCRTFHVVFSLPAKIADIAYQNKAAIYDILFKASAETMITIAADPKHLGARVGVHSVLHTWGSALNHHPHVHMIVPGGGISLALVTELRRTEFQLRLHQDSLARVVRLGSVGELAAAIAHEINQPLMAAGTYSRLVSEMLRERNNNPSLVEMADKVATQVERASEVVRRLRALVKSDRTDWASTTIVCIVNEALDLCQPELNRSGIRCQTILQGDLPPVVVDRLQIEQVMLNLVRNAIEAMNEAGRKDGEITIEAKQSKSGDVELSVRDTGAGFPDELLIDEFPPFGSTKAEGLGIGLSLSRTIIESHGGQLTAGSDANGTIVQFTLPAETKSHG